MFKSLLRILLGILFLATGVMAVRPPSVTVAPHTANITSDSTLQLTASYFSSGVTTDVTNSAVWSTNDPGATVHNGQYHPGRAGSYCVTATDSGLHDSCLVTVTQVTTEKQLVNDYETYRFNTVGVTIGFPYLVGADTVTVKLYSDLYPPYLPTSNNPIKKYFSIHAGPGITDFNAILFLSYTVAEFGASNITSQASLYCARYNGTSWEPFSSEVDSLNRAVSCFTSAFSLWGIGGAEGMLPVTLSGLAARAENNGVTISWSTQSEVNNLGFNVLRQNAQGGQFVRINSALVPGAGTTTLPHYYSYTDQTAVAGECTYQLEQVNIDGSSSFLGTVAAAAASTGVLDHPRTVSAGALAATISGSRVQVTLSLDQPQAVSLSIFDVHGNAVERLDRTFSQAGTYHLTSGSLLPGCYVVKIQGKAFSAVEKVLIVR